jgi:hypothetical protein
MLNYSVAELRNKKIRSAGYALSSVKRFGGSPNRLANRITPSRLILITQVPHSDNSSASFS